MWDYNGYLLGEEVGVSGEVEDWVVFSIRLQW